MPACVGQQDGYHAIADLRLNEIAIDLWRCDNVVEAYAFPAEGGARLPRELTRLGSDENVSHPRLAERLPSQPDLSRHESTVPEKHHSGNLAAREFIVAPQLPQRLSDPATIMNA